jgi:hypothetical protein
MEKYKSEIFGHLDIFVAENEDERKGEKMQWKEILIHGDPEGLRSFAKLLMKLADANQDNISGLPTGGREHIHLRPKWDLSNSSEAMIVGRLDAKGTGEFYERYDERSAEPQ